MTLFSSVCASSSRVRLAHTSGLCLGNYMLEYQAGRHADKAALMTAHELGLRYTSDVLRGAARAGDLAKVVWLYTEQHCAFDYCYYYDDIRCEAGRNGSIAVLDW